jgi:hypothetical protein
MKRMVLLLVVVLFSGCINYFDSAEKTTSIEIGEEKITTELYYKGKLSEKGKEIENCLQELKKLFPSIEAKLQANINDKNETKRKIAAIKLLFLKEIKDSLECELKKEASSAELKIKFQNSKDTIKELSKLSIEEEFILYDLNKEYSILKIKPELKDYFSSSLTQEHVRIKIKGDLIEIKPDRFSIKNGFIQFYNTKEIDANFIEIEFTKEKEEEFPFMLIAASFVVIVFSSVIFVIWKKRKPEEIFVHTKEELKQKMKKELINGLGTTDIQILKLEQNMNGYESEVIIKTRKYHITFNKKMELTDYIRIE